MNTLKELVALYGYGIIVKADKPEILPLKILKPIGTKFYEVEIVGLNRKAHVLREQTLTHFEVMK